MFHFLRGYLYIWLYFLIITIKSNWPPSASYFRLLCDSYPSQIFLHLILSCSPWKKMINTVLTSVLPFNNKQTTIERVIQSRLHKSNLQLSDPQFLRRSRLFLGKHYRDTFSKAWAQMRVLSPGLEYRLWT